MKWSPLGNEALIVECHAPAEFAKQLRDTRPSECLDVVSSYRHLAVYFSPADSEVIQEWLSKQTPSENSTLPRQHQIPVWYDQDWLTEFSDELSLSIEEIISLHSSATYTVAALGFSPGFPYLTGLPKKLQLPRKDTPARLPAGTVAIAADQAGIYPNDSFGGWHPLGLTDAPLFNPDQSPHSLLEPSDELTFLPVADKPSPVTRPSAQENSSSPTLTIESAGPATSIQDPGRPGHRHLGITSGGCADPEMATALNLLLGNQQEAPVLEFALEAPVIRFAKPTSFAFLGPQHPQAGRVINIRAGQVLDLKNSAMQSSFGVLAIKSGFDVPKLLKSAATDIRGSFGGKLIQKGDSLRHRVVEDYHKSNGNSHSPAIRWPLMSSNSLTVRILSGEHSDWFPETWTDHPFHKSARFDRTAARLQGPTLDQTITEELTSRPVVAGAIQVPPDGIPTALLPECQTIGGYPVIAHIISADLPAFTRAKPGTQIHFQKVTLEESHRAFEIQERELAFLRCGLNFLK